jgi:hypothetical protein
MSIRFGLVEFRAAAARKGLSASSAAAWRRIQKLRKRAGSIMIAERRVSVTAAVARRGAEEALE